MRGDLRARLWNAFTADRKTMSEGSDRALRSALIGESFGEVCVLAFFARARHMLRVCDEEITRDDAPTVRSPPPVDESETRALETIRCHYHQRTA